MRNLIISLAAASVLCVPALAHPGQHHPKSAHHPKRAAALVCPVTGEKIASAKAAAGHSTYKGKTYYFCCGMCKPKFDKNPAGTLKNAAKGKFEKM